MIEKMSYHPSFHGDSYALVGEMELSWVGMKSVSFEQMLLLVVMNLVTWNFLQLVLLGPRIPEHKVLSEINHC